MNTESPRPTPSVESSALQELAPSEIIQQAQETVQVRRASNGDKWINRFFVVFLLVVLVIPVFLNLIGIDWTNRFGIILNFMSGFMLAPELLGEKRMYSLETGIKRCTSMMNNVFGIVLHYTPRIFIIAFIDGFLADMIFGNLRPVVTKSTILPLLMIIIIFMVITLIITLLSKLIHSTEITIPDWNKGSFRSLLVFYGILFSSSEICYNSLQPFSSISMSR